MNESEIKAIEIIDGLSLDEKRIIKEVYDMLEDSEKLNPFIVDSNSKLSKFKKANVNGVELYEAELLRVYMVVDSELGTIYQDDRGTGLLRGSLIVKLDEESLYATGKYWYGVSVNELMTSRDSYVVEFEQKGIFRFTDTSVYKGILREIKDIII